MASLTRDEALSRAALISLDLMQVDLDLTQGDAHFGSHTTISFSCAQEGAETFVDLRPVTCERVVLNGVELDPAQITDGRLTLRNLRADNTLEVTAQMAYSRDGQGLHRSVDPSDGAAYIYGHLFLDAAPTVFACFDQPDLKAPYEVTVTAPSDWLVVGNGAESRSGDTWTLARTQPLATYFVTVCAGPYAVERTEHDGIPMAIYARGSLSSELSQQAPQIFEITRQAFDYYHQLFGIRYPFGKYDQAFVPEFNAGAMENPGCVTIRDAYLFRGAATREELTSRSNTVAHELAHMWFGDLVTMQWWDDLWLNESFAEYLAYRALTEATEFTDAWVEFSIIRKMWGYAAERTPSTHPVAGSPAPDAQAALNNFDGISYAKGASALRQLIAHIGDDAFIAGLRTHLNAHQFGNADLADFLAALEESSEQDLSGWVQGWLRTAGADTLSTEVGGIIKRTPPSEYPADRPHTFDVAGFTAGEEIFRVPVTVSQDVTRDSTLADAPAAELVIVNASDQTWATCEIETHSLAALPQQLPLVADPVARAVTWVSLFGGVYRATIDPRRALDTFTAAWPKETNDAVLGRVAAQVTDRLIPSFLPPEAAESARSRVAGAALTTLHGRASGSGAALAVARVLAKTTSDNDRLESWLAGHGLPAGLDGDADFRWLVIANLASRGVLDEGDIAAELSRDNTLSGRRFALAARAAIPTASAKGWAWTELTTNRELSNYDLLALAGGFWKAPDIELVRPYVPRYAQAMQRMSAWVGEDALARVAAVAFPAAVVEPATAEMARAALASEELTQGVRRSIVDQLSELQEALASRAAFG